MNEKLLAFVWLNRLYDNSELKTTQGEKIDVVKPGFQNRMSGPDISDAHIRIGEILWVGNVEFHVKSSHWKTHHHDIDPAYSNIILHVVFVDDEPLCDALGNLVPTLVLKFSNSLAERYSLLLQQKDYSYCNSGIAKMSSLSTVSFTSRLAVERLERKVATVASCLKQNKNDWYETFWQLLSRGFGFGKNSLGFELMAKSLPYKLILKNLDSFVSVISMMYGQAGFLDEDHYKGNDKAQLKLQYNFNSVRYSLNPIDSKVWKYSGMRPQNSPFLRMRQLAKIITKSQFVFSDMLEGRSLDDMLTLLSYEPNAEIPELGLETKFSLIINIIVPFLVSYSNYTDDFNYSERAYELLEEIPAEKNSIVTEKRKSGFIVKNALDSQAVIELENEYCKQLRCIDCQIGRIIVSKGF